MHDKATIPATSPELLAMLETARAHQMTKEDIEAQRRSWVIGELMLDDATLTREAAEALYDEATDAHGDDLAVDRFAGFMKRKLARKREQGRGGWHDPEQCTIGELSEMLIEHVDKGDPLDVAIFAMMVHHRGGRIASSANSAQPIETAPANTPVLVWWPTVALDEFGDLTDRVTGGIWIVSKNQGGGYWLEPDVLNCMGQWFGDEEEYAESPTHWRPMPDPLGQEGRQ